jgi:hypothetical protein
LNYKPFAGSDLNRLELTSITVTLLTLNIGIFYNTEAKNSSLALFLLMIVIMVSNGYFLVKLILKFFDQLLGKLVNKVPCLKKFSTKSRNSKISNIRGILADFDKQMEETEDLDKTLKNLRKGMHGKSLTRDLESPSHFSNEGEFFTVLDNSLNNS